MLFLQFHFGDKHEDSNDGRGEGELTHEDAVHLPDEGSPDGLLAEPRHLRRGSGPHLAVHEAPHGRAVARVASEGLRLASPWIPSIASPRPRMGGVVGGLLVVRGGGKLCLLLLRRHDVTVTEATLAWPGPGDHFQYITHYNAVQGPHEWESRYALD